MANDHNLHSQYASQGNSDVTFTFAHDNRTLQGNSDLLSRCSPVLKEMITLNSRQIPNSKTCIRIGFCDFDTFDIVLKNVYTGTTRGLDDTERCMDVCAAAVRLELVRLQDECLSRLRFKIKGKNAVRILALSLEADRGCRSAERIISKHGKDILMSCDVTSFKPAMIRTLLDVGNIGGADVDVFNACLKWCAAQLAPPIQKFREVLFTSGIVDHVDFGGVSSVDMVSSCTLVPQIPKFDFRDLLDQIVISQRASRPHEIHELRIPVDDAPKFGGKRKLACSGNDAKRLKVTAGFIGYNPCPYDDDNSDDDVSDKDGGDNSGEEDDDDSVDSEGEYEAGNCDGNAVFSLTADSDIKITGFRSAMVDLQMSVKTGGKSRNCFNFKNNKRCVETKSFNFKRVIQIKGGIKCSFLLQHSAGTVEKFPFKNGRKGFEAEVGSAKVRVEGDGSWISDFVFFCQIN